MGSPYVELQLLTHHSFLRGASDPRELFAAASVLGYDALGVADLGTVGGMVRCWEAAKTTGVRSLPGARVDLDDGRRLLLYATDRRSWSRLTRLLTLGKARGGKGACVLNWTDVAAWADGLIAILLPDEADDRNAVRLGELADLFGDRAYMALSHRRRPDDTVRLDRLAEQARAARVRSVATGDVLYHAPEARLLQDVVTAC